MPMRSALSGRPSLQAGFWSLCRRLQFLLDVPPSTTGKAFDVVIFDTAPTGHTLRLLELPAEWSQSIDTASQGSGQTCIGPAAAIQDAKHKYERTMSVMRDPAATVFTFVLHPEAVAIKETRRAIGELGKLGITHHQLIVNSVIPPEARTNPLFAACAEMQTRYLTQITQELPVPTRTIALLPGEIKGAESLRAVGAIFFDGADPAPALAKTVRSPAPSRPCPSWTVWLSACRPTATAARCSLPARAASARPSHPASPPSG